MKNVKSNNKKNKKTFVFLSVIGALIILFYAFWMSKFYVNNLEPSVLSVYSGISAVILNALGQNVVHTGPSIQNSFFSVYVARGCDAIEAMGLFSIVLLAFPMNIKQKIKGLFIGNSILFCLNVIRIVTLFLAGRYYPSIFDMMHIEIWQVIFILSAFLLLALIIRNYVNKNLDATEK